MSDIERPIAQMLCTPSQRLSRPLALRRARAACIFCRARKIRCDAQNRQPCSNCLFENVQCILVPKQRRTKKAPAQKPRTSPAAGITIDKSASPPQDTTYIEQLQRQMLQSPSSTTNSIDQIHSELDSMADRPRPADLGDQSTEDLNDEINWREAALKTISQLPPQDPSNSPPFDTSWLTSEMPSLSYPIPSFFKPVPPTLTKEDVCYLGRKGALSLPEPELRDALIESYALYIHPCYPMLDLELLDKIICGKSDQQFSLLVFQAIMYTGMSWVDHKLLRRLGFLTRKAARHAFYLRVKLLYDADYEQDYICQIQALLLLSTWWKAPHEQKDGWHWFGIALSLAQSKGLHQDASNKNLSPKARAMRRRLWWCCVIRNTCVSFATNRVPRLRESDFAVAPLTLDDFEYHEHPRANRRGIGVQPLKVQKQLATMCIQTAGICRIITRVLLAAYHETSTGNIDTLYFNSTPRYGVSHIEPGKLKEIEEDFRIWSENAPPNVLHASPTPSLSLRHEQAPLAHRAMLSILYYTGLIMIHRQRIPSSSAQGIDESTPSEPRAIVRDAARQVNKIVMDAYAADLMKDVPPTVISCLFPVSISHLLDMRSRDPLVRREGQQRLEECRHALRDLADGHLCAEWAINFLTYVESKVTTLPQWSERPSKVVSGQSSRFSGGEQPPITEHEQYPRQVLDRRQGSQSDTPIPGFEDDGLFKPTDPPPTDQMLSASSAFNPLLFTLTPDTFPDTVTFPDTWFGVLDAQFNVPNMGWFENDNVPISLG